MTLVDDDEVEEVRPEEFAEALLVVLAEELLVEREVDLVRCDRRAVVGRVVDLVDDAGERPEILLDGLVDEDVAVGQVEDLLPEARLAQPVDDLEGRVRLARARRHDEQQADLPAGNRIECTVDGDLLIVARRKRALRHIEGLLDDLHLRIRQMALFLEARDELRRARERVERQLALDTRQIVELCKSVAVRAVGEFDIHHLGIRLGLLQAVRDSVLVVFRLDDRQRMARLRVEYIVGKLRPLAHLQIPPDIDPPRRDRQLHADVRRIPDPLQRRRDVAMLDILLRQERLVRFHMITTKPFVMS